MPILPRRIVDNNDSIKYPITGMNYNVDMWKRNGESIEKEEEEEKRTFTSQWRGLFQVSIVFSFLALRY